MTAVATSSAIPAISVIIATYNRSQVLRYAIQSVRDSTFTDWEIIVVGDACTDDTDECVASFGDPRIRFVNLPERCGDQSGPNNHGIGLARGQYIAFLNHDDLYLPGHLAGCLAEIKSSGTDLVWVPCAVASPKTDSTRQDWPFCFALSGVPLASGYSPFSFYFASSWLLRRSLAERVGPWRASDRVNVTPSQDWLFRAWRSGARLRFLPVVSVIVVPAGPRPGCYTRRTSPDHELLLRRLKEDPRCREQILEEIAVGEAMQGTAIFHYPSLRVLRRLMLRPLYALLVRLRIHPAAFYVALRCGGRGALVRDHRPRTGAH